MVDTDSDTIASLFPELLHQLRKPKDANKAAHKWVDWQCGIESHRPTNCSAESWLSGAFYCGGCHFKEEFYASHTPGEILEDTRQRHTNTKLELAVAEKLADRLPGFLVNVYRKIVVPASYDYHGMYCIAPDIFIIPIKGSKRRSKIVIEIDGGDGESAHYSRHDTKDGADDDIWRDTILAELSFKIIRIRHPNALSLSGSPAKIIRTKSKSPQLISEKLLKYILY